MNKSTIKIFFLFIISLLFLILSMVFSAAMGFGQVEQARLTFEPNLERTYSYIIIPTNDGLDYSIVLRGDLSQYVSTSPTSFERVPLGQRPGLKATVKFPSQLPPEIKPGLHQVYMRVEEEWANMGGGMSAKSAADIRIDIMVLYPTKYLAAGLNVDNINENEDIKADMSIINYGEEIINTVKGVIEIYDSNDNLVKILSTNTEILLETNIGKKLTATESSAGLKPGDYTAKAKINWDENTTILEKSFRIGSLNIAINSFTVEFEQNKINPVNINIESLWNNLLENVYGEVRIGGEVVKTPVINLEPWQKETLIGYWNTKELELGEQNIKITILYPEGEITTKEGIIKIIEQKEKIIAEEKPSKIRYGDFGSIQIMMYILTLMVFVLIGFNVFLMMKNKK